MNGGRQKYGADGLPHSSRWKIYNNFVDHAMRALSPAAERTWHVLFRHARKDGRVKIAQTRIALAIGRRTQAVVKAIQELERAGLLVKVSRGGLNRGPSWYIVVDAMGEADRRQRVRSR